MHFGIVRLKAEGFPNGFDGNIVVPDLGSDNAEQVQRLDLIRVQFQDLAVGLLGLLEVPD